jgi:hypothetical protein
MIFLLGKWLRAMKWKAASSARTRRAARRTSPSQIMLSLERLEDRTVPSTLTVTSPADDGSAGGLGVC